MEKSLKYNYYNQFSIFELRNIGREKGVKLPTTLKKKDLIEQIIKLELGEISPYVNTTKQGRPVKNRFTKQNDTKQLQQSNFKFFENSKSIKEISKFLLNFQILCDTLSYDISQFLETNKVFIKEE